MYKLCLFYNLAFSDKFRIVDIVRVTSLAVSCIQQGVDLTESLRYAVEEIYAKPMLDLQTREVIFIFLVIFRLRNILTRFLQGLRSAITKEIANFDPLQYEADTRYSSLTQKAVWPDPLPSVADWSKDVTSATVRLQMAPFSFHVSEIASSVNPK